MANESLMESLSLNLPAMAQIIKKKGRGKDTVLAHITPEEAKLLKKRGGRGSINPETGLLEFEDFYSAPEATYTPIATDIAPSYTPQAGVSQEYTGGGYTPEGYTPTYTPSTPEVVPTQTTQPAIDFSQYTGAPGVTQYAGAPGVSFTPAQQSQFGTAALPQPTGLEPVVDVGTAPQAPQTQQGILDKLAKTTGLSTDTLAKLGIGGLTALGGISATRKAQAQGQQAKQQQMALAQPYQTQGQELVRQAQAGELTPQSQQAYQAAQAQVQQGIAQRGGVGEAQAATQLANIRNNLLNNQYQTGLQVLGIGDNIAVGAITTGIQADQYVNTLTQNYFTNIARVMAGQPPATTPTQPIG
jgi:hypothetical protein